MRFHELFILNLVEFVHHHVLSHATCQNITYVILNSVARVCLLIKTIKTLHKPSRGGQDNIF